MSQEIITKEKRKQFLSKKNPAYQSGWFAGEKAAVKKDAKFKQIIGHPKAQHYYEAGYFAAIENLRKLGELDANN